ncbi:MAG: fused MFS/spermidine synthase [Planctomycetes bacterium]|nr:fused MFS/spermidine synthase [Planctomycetota bacterium]
MPSPELPPVPAPASVPPALPPPPSSGPSPLALLLFAFFFSGVAGLVYEVVWARRLSLILGSTSLAISTVLAAYMAGLGLGSWALGRAADRVRNRVRLYALLELGIGLYGFATPWLFLAIEALYRPVHLSLHPGLSLSLLVRFAFAFVLLLFPTFLMGGTLPILSRHLVEHENRLGRRLGLLYSANTFGAVVGVLVTGFLLIPGLGLRWTIWTAAGLNVAVGLFVLFLRNAGFLAGEAEPPQSTTDRCAQEAVAPASAPSAAHRAVVLVFGVAGFASFLYEVAWTRILGLVTGSATNAFTVMLASFLLGLALGSWVLSRWIDRQKDLVLFLAGIEAALGVLTLFLLPAFGLLPDLFLWAFPTIHVSYARIMGFEFLMALGVMLLPTLLIGATFPVVAKIYARGTASLGRRVGEVYVANTLGGILGSVIGGFLVLPLLSSPVTSLVGSGLNLVCAALLAGVAPSLAPRARALFVAAALACLLPIPWVGGAWDRAKMTSGVYVFAPLYERFPEAFARVSNNADLRFYEEGLNCITTVREDEEGTRLLQVNGKTDASNRNDMVTQSLCAFWPLALAPKLDEVLVVGLGSGVTAGAAARFPVGTLDVVEIEGSIVNASRFFREENHAVLEDPRVRLVVEDGRTFVALSEKKYDAIVSEPSNPWMAGSSSLFTLEHFRNLAAALKEEGVVSQWVQSYGMSPTLVRSVFRTFLEVFPHALLVADPAETNDFILVGSRRPLPLREEALARWLGTPGLREDLAALGYASAVDLLSAIACHGADLLAYAGNAPFNTDDFPLVEFETPKHLYREALPVYLDVAAAVKDLEPPVVWAGEPRLEAFFLRLAARHEQAGRVLLALAVLRKAAARLPASSAVRLALGEAALRAARAERTRSARRGGRLSQFGAAGGAVTAGTEAAAAGRPTPADLGREAYGSFAEAVALDPGCGPALLHLGELALGRQDFAEAERRLAAAVAAGQKDARTTNNLGAALLSLGRKAEAEAALRTGLGVEPENHTLLENLGNCLAQQGKNAEAAGVYDKLLGLRLAQQDRDRIARARAGLPAGH